MKTLKEIFEYLESKMKKIPYRDASWWTTKGDTNISMKTLYKIRKRISDEIKELNSLSEWKLIFECKLARRYGSDAHVTFFYLIPFQNESYKDLEEMRSELELYMGRFIRSLIRDFHLPASIYIILDGIDEGDGYYALSQKIEFRILEEMD